QLRCHQARDQQACRMRHARVFSPRRQAADARGLHRHNCLAFNLEGGQLRGWFFKKNGKTVNIRVGGSLDCNDGELLLRWATEGLGIAWRSTWEIAGQLERGELITVLDDYSLPAYDIFAVYPQHRHVPAKVRL